MATADRIARIFPILVALCLPRMSGAVSPGETDPKVIMQTVEERETGDLQLSRMQITIRDKAGRERTRVVQGRTMSFEGGTRQLIFFESPADVRNAGMLSIDYDDGDATDDQWLYLPSLKRTTRISSSDKSGSFMGTDMTYSDMTSKDSDDYDYTLVEASVDVGGEACWKIEATPKSDATRSETGYTKTVMWVSKAKLMTLQAQAWLTDGQSQKLMKSTEVRMIDGVWIAHELTARLMRAGEVRSTTVMKLSHLRLNTAGVTEADFTQRRLEQGL